MISEKQFEDATAFLATYQEALNCVEQIAEQKQTMNHYEQSSESLVNALQNDEIKLTGTSVAAGSNAESFVFSKAHSNTQQIFAKYKFASAATKEEFMKSMETAVEDLAQ